MPCRNSPSAGLLIGRRSAAPSPSFATIVSRRIARTPVQDGKGCAQRGRRVTAWQEHGHNIDGADSRGAPIRGRQ